MPQLWLLRLVGLIPIWEMAKSHRGFLAITATRDAAPGRSSISRTAFAASVGANAWLWGTPLGDPRARNLPAAPGIW
jgi:hypothetical protein